MGQYVLGIDAGATKVLARLETHSGELLCSERDGPASLTNQREQTVQRIRDLIRRTLSRANVAAEDTSLVCGIAGSSHKKGRTALEKALKELKLFDYLITSDAVTSLYGAGDGQAMISVAIGTGSVAMRLDNTGKLKEFGGWGFQLGDQGSGAYIGRELIKLALPCFDRNDYQADKLLCEVFEVIGKQRSDILDWAASADPSDYAKLAKLLLKHETHPLTERLLNQASAEIVTLINNAQTEPALPITLQGGLANVIDPRLPADIKALVINSKGDAVDGALFMARNRLKVSE